MAGLMDARRRILQNTDVLPPKYQRVEYVIGNGTASSIDTGIPGNNDNLRFVFGFEINEVGNHSGIFGNYVNEQTDCWRLICQASSRPKGFYHTHNRIASSSGGLYIGNDKESYAGLKLHITMDADTATLRYDDYQTTDTFNRSHGTANNNNIAFGSNKVGNGSAHQTQRRKYYYCRIYDNGKLIRDYLPCYRKSDNKAGFYDTVNHTFNPSTGAADFILPT